MTGFEISMILMVSLALIAAIGLTLAAKFMAVPVNETEQTLRDILPGANCGACGFAGCADYAAALSKKDGKVAPNLCTAGGSTVAKSIGDVLGIDPGEVADLVAFVGCSASKDTKNRQMHYLGYASCVGAKQYFGGEYQCKQGCLGFGDCVNVCTQNAIAICNGLAVIDHQTCLGCGVCAKVCPNGLLVMVPKSAKYVVGCSATTKGKETRDSCTLGCIGCKLCEKVCKFDAIHVENNCATIDQTKCKNCGACAKVCPRHIIVSL